MNTATLALELITPCLSAGARPEQQAELRATAIRGQLRWWFRVLGGFKSLSPMPVHDQEALVFGLSSARRRQASSLSVRVRPTEGSQLISRRIVSATSLDAPEGSDRGYLFFPLEHRAKAGFLAGDLPRFELSLLWRGEARLWPDLLALVAVFGHLGSLGFRSRRALGALAFRSQPPSLSAAWPHFGAPAKLLVKSLPARDAGHATVVLARWLRKWRSYGRSAGQQLNRFKPGFDFARRDHDAGLNRQGGPVFRPALGLPIDQTFSAARRRTVWTESWDAAHTRGFGRFASPILLRPHRLAEGRWLALVIFVDSLAWPAAKKVYLNGQPRPVAPDLYLAMQQDRDLLPLPA